MTCIVCYRELFLLEEREVKGCQSAQKKGRKEKGVSSEPTSRSATDTDTLFHLLTKIEEEEKRKEGAQKWNKFCTWHTHLKQLIQLKLLIQLRQLVEQPEHAHHPGRPCLFVRMCVIDQRMVCMGGWDRFMIVGMDWFDSFMIAALSPVSPGKQRWTEPFWGGPTYGSDPNTDHILYQMMMIAAATHCLHRHILHHSHMILLEEQVNVDEEGVFGCGPAAHSVSPNQPSWPNKQSAWSVSHKCYHLNWTKKNTFIETHRQPAETKWQSQNLRFSSALQSMENTIFQKYGYAQLCPKSISKLIILS